MGLDPLRIFADHGPGLIVLGMRCGRDHACGPQILLVAPALELEGELTIRGPPHGLVGPGKGQLGISGPIVAINDALEDDPAPINEDCYGDGWIYKLAPSNPADVEGLLEAEKYEPLTQSQD